jgi:hypothetical protein
MWTVTDRPCVSLVTGIVYAAHLHAAGVGTDRPVPARVISYRIKPEHAAQLNAFTARPEITQTLASSGGKKGATTELRLKPDVLYRKYEEAVPEAEQVSRSIHTSPHVIAIRYGLGRL